MPLVDSITGFAKSLENFDPCLRTIMDVLPSGVVYLNVYVNDWTFAKSGQSKFLDDLIT